MLYKGRNIFTAVLAMTVEEARGLFDPVPAIARKLQTLLIKTANWLIDMGPDGGSQVLVAGTPATIAACAASHTGRFLAPLLAPRGADALALAS